MKSIDTKSLLIGALLASTMFFGVAATGPSDKWDSSQIWEVKEHPEYVSVKGAKLVKGWEPFVKGNSLWLRRRIQ